MEYLGSNISQTTLPMIIIEKDKCGREYKLIGSGSEGEVYRCYNLALKMFHSPLHSESLTQKFKKIELLGKLQDDSACFPKGFVGYSSEKIEGYFCELVEPNNQYKDFDSKALFTLKDIRKKLQYIIEADEAVQRFHKMGLILGDIKGNNIMINPKGKIKFVDTDNWVYENYGFDAEPIRSKWLQELYHKNFSLLDNDKFAFAMMAIQILLNLSFSNPNNISDKYFQYVIHLLDVKKETKELLRMIFSDENDKPYIGDILKTIDTEKIISEEKRKYLHDTRMR